MSRIFHGDISGNPNRPSRPLASHDLDPDVNIGDLVSRWDHYFTWDQYCTKGKDLKHLRQRGDDLCDNVVRFLGLKKGDLLSKVETYMATTPRKDWDSSVELFWSSVEGLPRGINTSHGKYQPNFETPSPPRTLSRGQEVFWKYISPILTSLLHFSLVGQFSHLTSLCLLTKDY
jgi:hypothetical protein